MNSILCTICMRSGSQGVRNKNMILINGKPLMYYTIKQAIKSKLFDNIVVSTDSKKILAKAKSYGAEGHRIERPSEIASGIEQGLKSDKPYLLDIIIDGNEDPTFRE